MKKKLAHILGALLIAASTCCVLAQPIARPSTPITIQVYVHDPGRKPIEGATVYLLLPRYREGDTNEQCSATTNNAGIASVSGMAQQDYRITADKPGWYHTMGPRRGIDTVNGFQHYAVGVQKIDVELRSIRNPIHGIVKFVDRMVLPVVDEPVGFDLEVGDWTGPFGAGTHADLVFRLEGQSTGPNVYDHTLTLNFSNPSDGIILTKTDPESGSEFKFPYEAPISGYESERKWRKSHDGISRHSDIDINRTTNYIFRVRTELDEQGKVRRALYGIINDDVNFHATQDGGYNVSFVYRLNPTWTRNIEFDPAQGVRAGTGKLLVQPPPE